MRKFTDEQVAFLKSLDNRLTYDKMTELFNNCFDDNKSALSIRQAYCKYVQPKRKRRKKLTDDQIDFIMSIDSSVTYEDATQMFNNKFNEKLTKANFGRYYRKYTNKCRHEYISISDEIMEFIGQYAINNIGKISYRTLADTIKLKFNRDIPIPKLQNIVKELGLTTHRFKCNDIQLEWLKSMSDSANVSTITELFNKKFDINVSLSTICRIYKDNGIKRRKGLLASYTDEQIAYLRNMDNGLSYVECANQFNGEFGTNRTKDSIRAAYHRMGINRKAFLSRLNDTQKAFIGANIHVKTYDEVLLEMLETYPNTTRTQIVGYAKRNVFRNKIRHRDRARYPIGTVVDNKGCNDGHKLIKTHDGWVDYDRWYYDVPEDCVILRVSDSLYIESEDDFVVVPKRWMPLINNGGYMNSSKEILYAYLKYLELKDNLKLQGCSTKF